MRWSGRRGNRILSREGGKNQYVNMILMSKVRAGGKDWRKEEITNRDDGTRARDGSQEGQADEGPEQDPSGELSLIHI